MTLTDIKKNPLATWRQFQRFAGFSSVGLSPGDADRKEQVRLLGSNMEKFLNRNDRYDAGARHSEVSYVLDRFGDGVDLGFLGKDLELAGSS